MNLNLREVYAYIICIFAVVFGLPYIGDFLYTLVHMIFIADSSVDQWDQIKLKYWDAIIKTITMIVTAAGAFYIHWRLAEKKTGKTKKK